MDHPRTNYTVVSGRVVSFWRSHEHQLLYTIELVLAETENPNIRRTLNITCLYNNQYEHDLRTIEEPPASPERE